MSIPKSNKFFLVSLGCPKNLTDSENLMGSFSSAGYKFTNNPLLADTIVINTCAFLENSREESISTIKKYLKCKKIGECKSFLIAGCLPKYLSTNNSGSNNIICKNREIFSKIDGFIDSIKLFNNNFPKVKATPNWFSYVKISEGCNNKCAYCLIPSLRGKLQNRNIHDIYKEIRSLASNGVKEIIFVAQDTTAHPQFIKLLHKTSKIKNIKWIRIMYAHPKHVSEKLINLIAKEKKIVKYIDMPMQHSSNKILKAMNRGYDKERLIRIVKMFRKKCKNITIRTTFIIGFPGETEKDFSNLINFVKEMRFDRIGIFPFSREKETKAYNMPNQVPQKKIIERTKILSKTQEKISEAINRSFIGKTLNVLIEKIRYRKNFFEYIGRSYRDAPEVDGIIKIKNFGKAPHINCGNIVKVKIVGSNKNDLFGMFCCKNKILSTKNEILAKCVDNK